MTPKVPKVVEPKVPIQAESQSTNDESVQPKGLESLVSAGSLAKKAFTIKASLLG